MYMYCTTLPHILLPSPRILSPPAFPPSLPFLTACPSPHVPPRISATSLCFLIATFSNTISHGLNSFRNLAAVVQYITCIRRITASVYTCTIPPPPPILPSMDFEFLDQLQDVMQSHSIDSRDQHQGRSAQMAPILRVVVVVIVKRATSKDAFQTFKCLILVWAFTEISDDSPYSVSDRMFNTRHSELSTAGSTVSGRPAAHVLITAF
ncbi:hypothetical protein K438DRAFT_913802 [Mycena galopus ATCC 62051]|nr:hypothetical protein K438DRAFT_913802 [Mycena galopus ATCC 62051]